LAAASLNSGLSHHLQTNGFANSAAPLMLILEKNEDD
jgi:hypothetical protein